jgi:hypothetical protein
MSALPVAKFKSVAQSPVISVLSVPAKGNYDLVAAFEGNSFEAAAVGICHMG